MTAEAGGPEPRDLIRIAQRETRITLARWPTFQHERADIESDAMLGVAQAFLRYDPAHGVPFDAYATPRVRGAIIDGMRSRSTRSRTEVKRGVDIDDVAPERLDPRPLAVLWDGDQLAVDIPHPQAERVLYLVEDRAELIPALRRLGNRDLRLMDVVVRCVLLEHTQAEVARALGVTDSRVCQLLKKALRMLRWEVLSAA